MRPAQDAGQAVATDDVDITDANFARSTARIKAGGWVTWTNPDSFEHTATAAHRSFSDANERRETDMEISERELRRMVKEVDEQHRDGMVTMESDIRELHSLTRSDRLSRRSLLSRAGLGGFALAIGSTVLPASRLHPALAQSTLTDADIAAFAESVELTVVEAYRAIGAGGKVKTTAVTDAATIFAGHHAEHATAFAGASGGKATGRPNQKLLDTVLGQLKGASDEKAVIGLALDLENAAAGTYLFALGTLQSTPALALAASILPVESQHATTLATVLGKQGKDLVPPFETRGKAIDPAMFPLQ